MRLKKLFLFLVGVPVVFMHFACAGRVQVAQSDLSGATKDSSLQAFDVQAEEDWRNIEAALGKLAEEIARVEGVFQESAGILQSIERDLTHFEKDMVQVMAYFEPGALEREKLEQILLQSQMLRARMNRKMQNVEGILDTARSSHLFGIQLFQGQRQKVSPDLRQRVHYALEDAIKILPELQTLLPEMLKIQEDVGVLLRKVSFLFPSIEV